jgi:hypothetical protein
MANKRVTDLELLATAPTAGVLHFVDVTNATQNAAGSSFKVTKADFLKENTAAIALNSAKTGITPTQTSAITANTSKVGYTEALVNANTSVVANTAKVGITTGQASSITTNNAKVGYTDALVALAPSVVLNSANILTKAGMVADKNKFNKDAALIGFFLNENNTLSVNATFDVADFIPVSAGQVYVSSHDMRSTTFFNSSKALVVGGAGSSSRNITIPVGVFFIRVSIFHTNLNTFQLERGTVPTVYAAFKISLLDPTTLTFETIENLNLNGAKLINSSVSPGKTDFFTGTVGSINLYNPADADVVNGAYLGVAGLPSIINSLYTTSGFIPVVAGDLILIGNNGTAFNNRFIFSYDASKVKNGGSEDVNRTSFTVPSGATFIRVSFLNTNTLIQVQRDSIGAYVAFSFIFKLLPAYQTDVQKYESILGLPGKTVTQAALTTGNIIEITDFPYHLKKGLVMSFSADLTLAGSVTFGKGFGDYRGEYFVIDSTNIVYYYDSVLTTTKAHGLTIGTFLKASFSTDDNSIASVLVQSIGGYFKTTFQMANEMNYDAFIKTDGQTINNVKLSATCKDFQKSVWAFGDSYFGISGSRWVGSIKTFGYLNFLINGLAGAGSTGAYNDLIRCLKYGTPKYVFWCLGMNDTDAVYINNLNKVISRCAEKNITLILGNVPTVPTRNKEVIKETILNSGFRLVDFYKAVGTNSAGNWYTGYLSSDGVHPNQIGADALAMQVLVDFPEIMQYGKNL